MKRQKNAMNWKTGYCLAVFLCIAGHGIAQSVRATTPAKCPDAGGNQSDCDHSFEVMQAAPPPGPVAVRIDSTGGQVFGLQAQTEVVKGEPYQAEAVTEIRQTLADGTHIDRTITATVARDQEGRSVRSQKLDGQGPFFVFRINGSTSVSGEKDRAPLLTTIFDPVAGEHIDFTSDVKIAHVSPMSVFPPESMQGLHRGPILAGRSWSGPVIAGYARDGNHQEQGAVVVARAGGPAFQLAIPDGCGACNEKTKSLGTEQMEGVEAVGTRRTWTIPAGAIGNDRAIVTTEDTWYSPKLKLVLRSVRDDPRFGQTIYALKDLKLANPKESLFQVPPGYRIEKFPPPPFPPHPDFPGAPGPQ